MEAMLALLPPGAEDDILFKTLYVTKLPKEVRGQVLAKGMHLNSRELSELADDFWCGLNERHSGAKSHQVQQQFPTMARSWRRRRSTCSPSTPSTRRLQPRVARARESSTTSTRSRETRCGSVLTPTPARGQETSRPSGSSSSSCPHGQ